MKIDKRGPIYNFINNSPFFMAILCFGGIFGFLFFIVWNDLVLVCEISFISLWWLWAIILMPLIIILIWFKLSMPFSNTKKDELFKVFDMKYPEVYLAFKKFADELRASGVKRINISEIKLKIDQEIMPTINVSLLSMSHINRYAIKLIEEDESYRKLLSFNECYIKRKREKPKISEHSFVCGPRCRYYQVIKSRR